MGSSKKSAQQKKFFHYIVHHFLIIAAIFTAAVSVGYIAKKVVDPEYPLLANTSSSGGYSTTTSTLSPPEGLYIISASASNVSFSWNPVAGAIDYKIFRNGSFVTSGVTLAQFTDTQVTAGETYYYQVKTGGLSGESALSAPLYATVPSDITTNQTTTTTSSQTQTMPLQNVYYEIKISSDGIDCSRGFPETIVAFLAYPINGGDFLITSVVSGQKSLRELGYYPLPNGKYYWEGIAKTGFVSTGVYSGSFVLDSVCPVSLNTATGSTASTTIDYSSTTTSSQTFSATTQTTQTTQSTQTTQATSQSLLPTTNTTNTQTQTPLQTTLPPPPPQLKVFIDNKPVTDLTRTFDRENIELRVSTPPAKKVTFLIMGSPVRMLGYAVKDDLLSKVDTDVWSYIGDASKIEEGDYKIFARVLRLDGVSLDTLPVTFHIRHPLSEKGTESNFSEENIPMFSTEGIESERAKVLSRISDPSQCANMGECAIFCSSIVAEKESCVSYAQTDQRTALVDTRPSLIDGVSIERIKTLLLNERERAKNIPAPVETPEDMHSYCADEAHIDLCAKILIRNDLADEKMLNSNRDLVVRATSDTKKIFSERVGVRAFLDTDNDGVVDYDEINLYKTDPLSSDTDADGFPDGAEILSRTNPRGGLPIISTGTSSPTTTLEQGDEGVRFENPLIAGISTPSLLAVQDIRATKVSTSTTGTLSASEIMFQGIALPNSFVTLYIYSEPIVVTVKADTSGVWTYTLDKELPDGTHHVVAAVTDIGGRVIAKSETLPFVKKAEAVTITSEALLPANQEPGFFSGASLYAFIAIIIGVIGVAFSVIGFMVRRREDDSDPVAPA